MYVLAKTRMWCSTAGECDATNPPMWANVFEKLPHWRSTLPVICWMPRLPVPPGSSLLRGGFEVASQIG